MEQVKGGEAAKGKCGLAKTNRQEVGVVNENKVYASVVVTSGKDEVVSMGNISRPVVSAALYDSEKNIVDVRIVFSSLNDIRTYSKYKKGDVLYVIASIGEFPEDELILYPEKIIKLRDGEDGDMPPLKVKMRLEQYASMVNNVYVEGQVKKTFGTSSIVEVPVSKFVRGEEWKPASIFVTHDEGYVCEGEWVFFRGEIGKRGLIGKLYKTPGKEESQ